MSKETSKESNLDQILQEQKIVDIQMEKEVKTSFLSYAMSVIMSRALPDVRDGLKPVHRRILYAMYEDNLTSDKPFRKSATTVGDVLGRYHPHGDASVYDAMVRLAQSFAMRYPLVEGHGNFGNIDGDPPAAYRYTEARLAKLTNEMMRDIEKDVIDYDPNFDNTRREPKVLPSRIPNLLVNGSMGIAVGMATNIPPHNLGEVIDGVIALMENPAITVPELMNYIKGPDFPTGAMICGSAGIYEAYSTGRGRITVRARAEVQEEHHRIVFTEIPYNVNKSNLMQQIADCYHEKKVEGITAARDESGRHGLRVVVEYRRDANGQIILNQLYKYTQLQDTFAVNMLALVDNIPRVLGLKQILEYYVKHQEEVIVRRVRFDLEKALRDAHINEGYKIATDHIEEVIALIRSSDSIPDAKENLMQAFGLTEVQAQAIVEMTLGRLSGLERQKVEEKLKHLYEQIAHFRAILADEGKIKEIIREELTEIKRRYSDARRTELTAVENEILMEDLIERHTCVITMSRAGYIKRIPSDTYSAQHRGGKGIIGMTTKEEDYVERVIAVNSHSYLLFFTDRGRVYRKKAYQIPEAGRTAKGTNIVNVVDLMEGEKITSLLSVEDFDTDEYLTMVTRQGFVKRTSIREYALQRKGGKIAIMLRDDDQLLFVRLTSGNHQLLIASRNGLAVRFRESDITVTGRNTQGVIGIRLAEGDIVAGADIVEENKMVMTVTERGYGKRSAFSEYPLHHRGGKGVICHNTERTGPIAGIAGVSEDEDLMLITNDGTIIRTHVSDIPTYSRSAGGVIVMRMGEDAHIVNFAHIAPEENHTEDRAVAEEPIEVTAPVPEETENDAE